MSDYYNDFDYCKDLGDEYMDLITTTLFYEKGISLNAYMSRKYQFNVGESLSGIEIKHDSKITQTGSIYFESMAVKKDKKGLVEGGILRKDNTWLYIIGTDNRAYAFSKKLLQAKYQEFISLDRDAKENYTREHDTRLVAHKDSDGNVTSYGLSISLNTLKNEGMILFELDLSKYKRSLK